MTIVEKLKLLFKLESTAKAVEEGIKMKSSTKVVSAIIALLTAVVQISSIQHAILSFVAAHPAVSLVLTGLSSILALLHVPVKDATKIATALLLALLLFPAGLHAQIVTGPVNVGADDVQNLYAVGVTYNPGATPSLAGTGLYARKLLDAGTYAFTAVDALPNSVKPYTVTTNMGIGVAQRIATIGRFPIYVPTAAGVSFNGANTGWQWNAGALTSIRIKGNYRVLPTIRVLKSSVSGGTGYQPIVGVLFGFGQ